MYDLRGEAMKMSRNINITVIILTVTMFLWGGFSFAESVTVEVGADSPVVSTGKTHQVTARVLLKPSGYATERAPLAVALVIDKSGSMSADDKMENAKRGAIEALKFLGAKDIAAVIAYDTEAFVVTGAGAVNETAHFVRGISSLKAGGNTALYDGVTMGAGEIERFLESGYVPRIILLSDGLANVGPSSVRELASLGRALSRRGITVTTIGLGLDYDEDLMTTLASVSGGNSYFARTKDRLEDIFRRDMEDAVAITGRGVRVTLLCEDGVRPIRSVGREGIRNANEIVVDIDNLYGMEKYAIFELEIPISEAEGAIRAASVKVEYMDAVTGSAITLKSHLDIEYSANEDYARAQRDSEITSQAEIARNAEILEQAVKLSDSGRAAEASAILREQAQYLAKPEYADDERMQEEIAYLNSLAADISNEGEMSNEQRKTSVNRVYMVTNQQSDVSSYD